MAARSAGGWREQNGQVRPAAAVASAATCHVAGRRTGNGQRPGHQSITLVEIDGCAGALRGSCQMCAPSVDRIPFIESGRDGDCPPQSIDIRDAEDGFRPGRIGSAGDGPSHMIRAEDGHDFAHEIERHRCGKPFRVGAPPSAGGGDCQ